jgi:hypothetical protein
VPSARITCPASVSTTISPNCQWSASSEASSKINSPPHLESSQQRLVAIGDQVAAIAAAPQRAHAAARLNTLKTWQARIRKLLPVMLTVLSGVQAFSKEEPPADII